MWKEAMWIGVPKSELEKWKILEGDLTGRFAYYRCETEIKEEANLIIDITANSRYRLWINGNPVLSGPCKGDLYRHYYDTVDVSEYLKIGKNVFAVQVLYNNAYSAIEQTDERAAIFGVFTPGGGHRLAIEGTLKNKKDEAIGTVTTGTADWRVWLDGSYYLKSGEIMANLGAACEEPDFREIPYDWKTGHFSSEAWSKANSLEVVGARGFWETVGVLPRFIIKERVIPPLYEKEDGFQKEIETSRQAKTGILENGEIVVAAGEKKVIYLDAGRIVNCYPKFQFECGKDAEVQITYFERFVSEEKEIRRDDAEQGTYDGITDRLILNGKGVAFEPFWYRTFRFVAITIEAKSEAVKMVLLTFRKTGYPLIVKSDVKSSTPWVNELWTMCVRTLENCMMETYMDCPYYEQMQFPMDTRLQALFTYVVSGDTRLAKKALEDYHCSMIPDGLIHGKYPSAYPQIISTFSMHYIYMLQEYYHQTNDLKTVRKYFPDMDQILAYYDSKIGTDGLVGRLGYWEFVDWQPAWGKTSGTPEALQYGPSTIINLMYAYALECAAKLNEAAGRLGMAKEYRTRKSDILNQIEKLCWDEKREMYREGPEFEQYTCHAQAWAVLNELPQQSRAEKMLRHAAMEEDVLKCTFSTAYEWFRACAKTGVYDLTIRDMDGWIELPGKGCTCCPETPVDSRSECHAWSALPMYEMIGGMAGVCAQSEGWKQILVKPQTEAYRKSGLNDLSGKVTTPNGTIAFNYVYDSQTGKWNYVITLPKDMEGKFVGADGVEHQMAEGENQYVL